MKYDQQLGHSGVYCSTRKVCKKYIVHVQFTSTCSYPYDNAAWAGTVGLSSRLVFKITQVTD